jgi:hypothetical protein
VGIDWARSKDVGVILFGPGPNKIKLCYLNKSKRYGYTHGYVLPNYLLTIFIIIKIIIFLILIIILNLHNPSLSGSGCNVKSKSLGSGCNIKPKNLGCEFGCKAMS